MNNVSAQLGLSLKLSASSYFFAVAEMDRIKLTTTLSDWSVFFHTVTEMKCALLNGMTLQLWKCVAARTPKLTELLAMEESEWEQDSTGR